MNIDNHSVKGPGPIPPQSADTIVPLDQRMGLQGAGSNADPDPEFDQFYDALMKWIAGSEAVPSDRIQRYLKQYANAGGELPYRTTQKQMNALTQVMVRMKEQGQEHSAVYKEIRATLVSVSSTNMFVQQFMQEVFKPSDDEDDRENSSW